MAKPGSRQGDMRALFNWAGWQISRIMQVFAGMHITNNLQLHGYMEYTHHHQSC